MQIPMHAFKLAMQNCIQAHWNTHTVSPLSSLSQFLSSFHTFLCCLTVLVTLFDIHKMHYCAVQPFSPQGRLHFPVSPERRDSRFLSTAQQPSSPPGNNSTASLLVRTPLCHANCFVFWCFRSSQAFPLSKRQFGRGKKVFSPHFKI